MTRAVKLRDDYSASDLRRLAARSRHANAVRRLLALAAIRDGANRTDAARVGGHGPPDIARLGSPFQCRRARWPARLSARGAGLPSECRTAGRIEGAGRGGSGSARRTVSSGNGPGEARGHASRPTSATTMPGCSGRSARRAAKPLAWRSHSPARPACNCISRKSRVAWHEAPTRSSCSIAPDGILRPSSKCPAMSA